MIRLNQRAAIFPYATLFRSLDAAGELERPGAVRGRVAGAYLGGLDHAVGPALAGWQEVAPRDQVEHVPPGAVRRSEEHTSELQSRQFLVCRLLLDKKKIICI